MAHIEDATSGHVTCESCSLASARKGEHFEIMAVDDDFARIQALRFGMSEGSCVECVTRIPAGPIVVMSGRQEIAVGRGLAERIQVRKRHHGHHRDEHATS